MTFSKIMSFSVLLVGGVYIGYELPILVDAELKKRRIRKIIYAIENVDPNVESDVDVIHHRLKSAIFDLRKTYERSLAIKLARKMGFTSAEDGKAPRLTYTFSWNDEVQYATILADLKSNSPIFQNVHPEAVSIAIRMIEAMEGSVTGTISFTLCL